MNSATLTFSRRHFFGLAAGAVFAAAALKAAPVRAAKINLSGDVAIQGYDPVAYFTDKAAVEGDAGITAKHDGAVYHFANAANRDAFVANPSKYAPQYGGFCAYAVSQGYTAPVDPHAFSVVDDKLYLNYSKGVRSRWSKDIPRYITAGDANWPGLSAK